MRVGFRINNQHTWTGGINYLLNLARALRTHAPDIEPIIFAAPDLRSDLAEAVLSATGRPYVSLPNRRPWHDVAALFGIREAAALNAFRREKIELLFEAGSYYGTRLEIPTLSWIPDFQHRHLEHLFGKFHWWVRDFKFRVILARRHHVMLSSQDSQNDALHFYRNMRAKLHVVPFAARLPSLPTEEDALRVRQTYGLPADYLFLPNQFWVHKNHQVVVEALGILAQSGNVPLVVATGLPHDPRSPKLMEMLTRRSHELGLDQAFRILGMVPYADVLALNFGARALINPSLFEGWSTTVEEARALGTPMLLSSLAVHKEQAADLAIFFDPLDPKDCARAIRESSGLRRKAMSSESAMATIAMAEQRFATLFRQAALEATGR